MDEAGLLDRTRTLVAQARLPPTLGLGSTWIIVQAASPRLAPLAKERYEEALARCRSLYPDDVVDFSQPSRRDSTRYLLLRAGSAAVGHWLAGHH